MATNNSGSDYWTQRTLQLEEALNNRGVEYFHTLEAAYRQAEKETRQKIAALYGKLAANNEISMKGARKLLTASELDEFKWDVQEYIERAQESTVDGRWLKELENASLKYRISRLEAMRVHMQNSVELLMGNELDGISQLMADIYTDGYYRSGHMIQTGLGIGHSFAELDTRKIEKVLSKPWLPDGRNFSERIWGVHRPQLVNDLHTGLSQALIRGESYDKLATQISKKYGVAKYRAETLVRTEGAYFTSVSQQEAYREEDVEYQQFCATLDHRTSEICRSMDGKVFKTSEIEIGVNAPPLHCRCRSVMVPHFDGNIKERAARDENGKTVMVKGDLSYKEWQEKFVKNKS